MAAVDPIPGRGSPYREPPPVHRPEWDDERPAGLSWATRLSLVLVALLLWIAHGMWQDHALGGALAALPAAARAESFAHARAELQDVCVDASAGLEEHCRAEAAFLLKFPECDKACAALALPYLNRPPVK